MSCASYFRSPSQSQDRSIIVRRRRFQDLSFYVWARMRGLRFSPRKRGLQSSRSSICSDGPGDVGFSRGFIMRQGPSSAVRNSLLILALLFSTATGQGPEIRLTPLRTAPPGERAQERGSLVYSNDFDDASALDAFTILRDGQVSLESGQVRFEIGVLATAILNAKVDFSPEYNTILSDNSGLISWSCNVSNLVGTGGVGSGKRGFGQRQRKGQEEFCPRHDQREGRIFTARRARALSSRALS